MATLLTAPAVKRMRAGATRKEIRDSGCPGLILVIQPSGHKSWAMRISRPNGKQTRMALGGVDLSGEEAQGEPVIGTLLSLAAARQLANQVRRERAMGRDFVAARHAEQQAQRARAAATFDQAALDYVDQHVRRNLRRWQDVAGQLGVGLGADGQTLELVRGGLAQRWQSRAIADITDDDVFAIVDEARFKSVPGLSARNKEPSENRARHMYSALSRMFSWLVERRRVKSNPVGSVHKPGAPAKGERILTDAELIWVWKACAELPKPFGAAIRLMLLTAARKNEMAGMARSELGADGTWTLPGSRTKNSRVHLLPLPPLALALLAEVNTPGDLIFSTNLRSRISGWSKTKKRLDEAVQRLAGSEVRIPNWTLHDLRRTAASGMASIGVQPHVIEEILNHISGHKRGVAGLYNQYSYFEEKRAALLHWAAHVEGLVQGRPANVVPLRQP